jgi:hypothetical protein
MSFLYAPEDPMRQQWQQSGSPGYRPMSQPVSWKTLNRSPDAVRVDSAGNRGGELSSTPEYKRFIDTAMSNSRAQQQAFSDWRQRQTTRPSAPQAKPDAPRQGGWPDVYSSMAEPQQATYNPYTNNQGQGFMGSMSFAPNTPVSYQNQAYGQFANSQGYYQQPQGAQRFAPQFPPNQPAAQQASPQSAFAFRQGQAQSIQPQSQGTPWGQQRTSVSNTSQPMSRWSFS